MHKNLLKFVGYYWKSLFVALIILILCLIPSSELKKIEVKINAVDVIVHFFMFAFFAAMLYWEMFRSGNKILSPTIIFKLVLTINLFLGIITELLQLSLKTLNRTGDWMDLLFDVVGSLTASFVMMMLTKRKVDRPT